MISKARGSARIWAAIASLGFAVFLGIQFIRPAISHPPVTADIAAPAEVKEILRNSCYDCHSNETRLAWFDEVVPAYWLVANDVREARSHLNFSEIGKLPPGQQSGILYEAVNQIQLGAMPLPAYTRLHRSAVVSPAQLSVLKSYLNPPGAATAAPAGDSSADDAQYEEWIRKGSSTSAVAPSPNGIEFLSDYKNWRAISSTSRFDNRTMRVILGNDAAVNAIAENRIDPWPDGAAFAKVAWFERDAGQGQVQAGAFFQVEFMIRDRQKYAATKGWGWARWRGAGLTPYGKDAGFSAECVGCHTPVRDSDYVYTMPIARRSGAATPSINQRAVLTGSLPFNPLQWKVITSSIDTQARTMSTLYGNDVAVQYARSNSQHDYPPGSVLSLVTWAQQEDSRWFGGDIPGQVKSVEFVTVAAGPDGHPSYSYENYQGSPLVKTEGSSPEDRQPYLLSLRAAVLP